MYGGKGGTQTSGKIWLKDGKFERGRTDTINVEVAQMLSPLSKIDIGHDNSGSGPGWFCEQVCIMGRPCVIRDLKFVGLALKNINLQWFY